jgi:BirA family biotin operon repressor/biotin-[acetyl-CoA-carboxylase] ligase
MAIDTTHMTFRRFAAELRSGSREAGSALVVLRQVDSTNLLARTVVRRLAGEGAGRVLFVAWEQTAGRGRLGRAWASSAGLGVYATLALQRAPDTPPLELLPLVAGVGLCRALRRYLPAARLKWPNDLVVGGRKVGGILIETLAAEQTRPAAILGFGVNHGHAEAELPTATATSLRAEGVTEQAGGPSLSELVLELASGLRAALAGLTEPAPILAAYRELTVHRPGDTLRCRMEQRSIVGRFLDFDARGRLRVRCGEETVVVAAGDVIEGEGGPALER